jgi:aromatic ring-cleaving dioxygenase
MDKPDALSIGYEICDQAKQLVKLLAIGVRADGSLLILDSGLTEDDANELYKDFRLWIGDKLSKELMQ